MGLITEYKVSCDNCFKVYELLSSTKKEATLEARNAGWVVGKKAICPECVEHKK